MNNATVKSQTSLSIFNIDSVTSASGFVWKQVLIYAELHVTATHGFVIILSPGETVVARYVIVQDLC